MMCRRWRPVPAHLYGRTRLVCTLAEHSRWEDHHNRPTGWSWDDPRQPTARIWVCNGRDEADQPHGALCKASYDVARAKGWRIHLDHGRIDAMCPDCAKPDPAIVALCRDLQASIGR